MTAWACRRTSGTVVVRLTGGIGPVPHPGVHRQTRDQVVVTVSVYDASGAAGLVDERWNVWVQSEVTPRSDFADGAAS